LFHDELFEDTIKRLLENCHSDKSHVTKRRVGQMRLVSFHRETSDLIKHCKVNKF